MKRRPRNVEFALYRGEECLAIGTKQEIAEQMGIKVKTVDFMKTPSYKKRLKKAKRPRLELVKLK